jgi:N-acetylmuramoyl-L-alanine amidase
VIMTRSDDRKLTLQQRVDIAVQNHADIFVSIHHNTHPNTLTNGTIVFYYNQGNSSKLASLVQKELVKATNYKDLQSRFGNYFVLRENPVVSILAEIGFLSNYNEEIRLRSSKQQDLAAEGIFKGILQYFASMAE